MKGQFFDDDVFCAHQGIQAGQQLGAQPGGEVGKLDPVAAPAFKDLQGKAVAAGVGDEDAISLAQAQVVAHLVNAGAQQDRDHVDILAPGWHRRKDIGHVGRE